MVLVIAMLLLYQLISKIILYNTSIERGLLWCGSVVMLSLGLVGTAAECILGVICIRSCAPQVRRKC